MYMMRFDLRAPGRAPVERSALHRAVIEMSAWADEQACTAIVVSEHHASDDGYLSTPFMLAAAIAAVTANTPIVVGAALLPLYDPVRLAEEILTLDHLSQGRALVVLGLGYRPEEYELFGVDYTRRGRIADEKLPHLLELLREAGAGGASARVTPPPFTSPIPMLAWGGRSKAAARRAGRNGIGFFGQANLPGLEDTYRETRDRDRPRTGSVRPPGCGRAVDRVRARRCGRGLARGWSVDARRRHARIGSGTRQPVPPKEPRASSVGPPWTLLRAEHGAHRVVTSDEAMTLIRNPRSPRSAPALRWSRPGRRVALPAPRRRRRDTAAS